MNKNKEIEYSKLDGILKQSIYEDPIKSYVTLLNSLFYDCYLYESFEFKKKMEQIVNKFYN